jgi:hypothetical protein
MVAVVRPQYENFDVRIEKFGDGYRTRVSADSSGEGEAVAELSGQVDQLDRFLSKVGHARHKTRGQAGTRLREAKKFGRSLFEAVFRGETLTCLHRSLENAHAREVGMRIRLRLTGVPELCDIPWEFLYGDTFRNFFSLSAYTPVVRYLEFPLSIRPFDIVSALRILVVIASPSNYPELDVEQEWERLRDALADLEERKLVVLQRLDQSRLGKSQLSMLLDTLTREHSTFCISLATASSKMAKARSSSKMNGSAHCRSRPRGLG